MRAAEWALVVVPALAAGLLAEAVGLPAGYLFGGMLVALGFALAAPGRLEVSNGAFSVGQAVAGVAVGTFLQSDAISSLGWRWALIGVIGLATVAITTVAGVVLGRVTDMDRNSAVLGMVAGGSSGVVAMAEELGGDERLVAFMQYTRVIAVTALTTLAIPLAFGVHASAGAEAAEGLFGDAGGWALVVGAGVGGTLLGRALRIPVPALLGPMLLTAALTLGGVLPAGLEVPTAIRDAAFALIGIRVGLGFDAGALRWIAGMAHLVAIAIAVLIGGCFLLGGLLALLAHVSLLDGYLATTPGGIFAVLPIAYGSGANTTFVVAAQGMRLVVTLVAAPLVLRFMLGARFHGIGEE